MMDALALDDFTKYKFISNTKFSPNGENLAFVIHEMDVDENKYLSNIWVYNVSTGEINKLTSFNQESSFVWLDENNIIFSTVREEKDKKRLEKILFNLEKNNLDKESQLKIKNELDEIKEALAIYED